MTPSKELEDTIRSMCSCTKDIAEEALFESSACGSLDGKCELVFCGTASLCFEGLGGEIGNACFTKSFTALEDLNAARTRLIASLSAWQIGYGR